MPIYEYGCQKCGRTFEYQQRMSDPEKTVCEACGGGLERLISRTAFALKGGGWYKDLYSSTKPEAKSGDSGGSSSGTSTSSSTPTSTSTSSESGSSSSSGSGTGTGTGTGTGSSGSSASAS